MLKCKYKYIFVRLKRNKYVLGFVFKLIKFKKIILNCCDVLNKLT